MSDIFKSFSLSAAGRMPRDRRDDLLSTTVRGMLTQERAVREAKTAKLRALRLASEAEAGPPIELKPSNPAKKKVTTGPRS